MDEKEPRAVAPDTSAERHAAQERMTHTGLRLLCISRAYPPVVGGMERLSADFTTALARHAEVTLVANRFGKKALPAFLLWAAVRARRLARQADVIHLGDALLVVLVPFLRTFRKPITVTLHGLDLRYPHPLYQMMLRRFLPRVSLALCISRFVEEEAKRRFPGLTTTVMNPGITDTPEPGDVSRAALERDLNRALPAGPLLLAVARLVRRKGLAWFVGEVLPKLPDAHLLILGDGPERAAIEQAASRAGVRDRVTFGGAVPAPDTVHLAYRVADLLVMPNIPVVGDAEGFGLVALEAASAGLPVVAADLEGIPDAVISDETGILVPAGDAGAWARAITALLCAPAVRDRIRWSAPILAREKFSWDRVAATVLNQFARLQLPAR